MEGDGFTPTLEAKKNGIRRFRSTLERLLKQLVRAALLLLYFLQAFDEDVLVLLHLFDHVLCFLCLNGIGINRMTA